MLEHHTNKRITFFIIVVCILMIYMTNIYAASNYNNVNFITIYYSMGGNGFFSNISNEQLKNRQYEYSSNNVNYIAYILHYVNSFDLINDGRNVHSADAARGNISIHYIDNKVDNLKFFSNRFVDNNGKQYGINNDDYYRFWDFIYALKTERIIINDDINFEPSIWTKENIETAINNGLVPNWNQINYTGNITRLEVCQLIENLLSKDGYIDNELKQIPFSDTKDKSVMALYALNIVNGKSETEFYPYDNITREEFSKILSETYKMISKDELSVSSMLSYKDISKISNWAYTSIETVTSLGFMQGDENGNFNPKDNITKEQVITILLRLDELSR